jgi:prepilin-type N-terminal cleavage/methylation domain-containing protein/prepilin-type processing-associated H-X9-DG protein
MEQFRHSLRVGRGLDRVARRARRALTRAFTLIETMIVCAIILLLAAILLPVLAQAKSAAKSTACLSQERQIGVAVMLYSADYDDLLPCAGESETEQLELELNDDSWTASVEPYAGGRLIYRCPTDDSYQWEALVDARQTTYGLNTYFTPNRGPFFGIRLTQVNRPSDCVLFAELAAPVTEDHFSPMFWGTPPMCPDPINEDVQWDPALGLPKTLDLTHHNGGSNYQFVDLHTKKLRFGQLWSQSRGSQPTVNAFDPTL